MPPTVKAVFAKKGFEEVHELQIGEYHLAYAEKQRMKSPCVYQEASFSLLLMGTAIIPQMPAEDSLKTVVAQYKTEGKIETSRLLGNYLIVLFHADGVQFYTDEANGYSLYFHRHGIWSDSQLAMVHALHSFGEPTSWAYDALNINLSIGFLYGEKTIFKEVYRFDTALHALANEWKYIANARTEEEGMAAPQDAAQAIDLQKETLQGIFKALTPTLRKGGVWCGLTAGLDSRLLALCAHTMAPDVAVKAFTNTQSPHSIQVKIAEQIARALKYDFTVHLHEGVCADIDSNLYFNDGMLRIYQIWLEESKSRASAQNRFATASAVLTGVGGEQYRNSTYTSSRAGEFEDWFRTEFIRRPIGVPFKHKRFESAMIRELKDYVHVRLQTSQHTSWQRSDAEQFMQRIFNPAVRLVRNTIENQISITLSPFTERTAMQAAMLAEPFTREHLSFEVRLIQAISSACDDIPFDYGFAPREAIPARYRRRMWLHRWIPTIATDAMHKWLRKRKARHPSKLMQLPQAEEALQAVRALPLHVDLDALLQNELMAPLVFELGFLILTLNDVVLQDDSIH